jgi:hypothetical protein
MVIRDRRAPARALIAAALTAAATTAAMAAAQQQPTTDPKPAANKNVVIVRGCLNGSMLTNAEPREYVLEVPSSMRTTGSRAMRGQLKEANGHTVELTGILKGVSNVATGALVKDVGKTKIYVGGTEKRTGDDAMMAQERVQLPTLDVSSMKDISSQCMTEKSN